MSRKITDRYIDYLILESPLLEGMHPIAAIQIIELLRQAAREFETYNSALIKGQKPKFYKLKGGKE